MRVLYGYWQQLYGTGRCYTAGGRTIISSAARTRILLMGENTTETHARNYVENTWKQFNSYHDHKEKMAYLTTALYLTGVSALIFQENVKPPKILTCEVFTLLAFLLSLSVFGFVFWQLLMRLHAFVIVAACDQLREKWIKDFSLPDLTDNKVLCKGPYRTRDLLVFLWQQQILWQSITGIFFATCLPLLAIFFWGIALLSHIWPAKGC